MYVDEFVHPETAAADPDWCAGAEACIDARGFNVDGAEAVDVVVC